MRLSNSDIGGILYACDILPTIWGKCRTNFYEQVNIDVPMFDIEYSNIRRGKVCEWYDIVNFEIRNSILDII